MRDPLHVVILAPNRSPGVNHKLGALSRELYQQAGIKTVFVAKQGSLATVDHDYQAVTTYQRTPSQALKYLLYKGHAVLYTRFTYMNGDWLSLLRRYPGRIIFEHNTRVSDEFCSLLKALGWRDLTYILRRQPKRLWSEFLRPIFLEKLYNSKCLEASGGGICNCLDSQDYVLGKVPNLPTVVIGNGIEGSSVDALNISPQPNSGEVHLLWVCGSPAPWIGADRLLNALRKYHGPCRFHLHLVGRYPPQVEREARTLGSRHQVLFYGFKSRVEIYQIASRCHAGIGTLALDRKKMRTCSTLKVCEYALMGLPVVLDNREQNFPEDYPYQLIIDGRRLAQELDRIPAFLEDLQLQGFSSARMRAESLPLVSMSNKAREIAAFIQEVVGRVSHRMQ